MLRNTVATQPKTKSGSSQLQHNHGSNQQRAFFPYARYTSLVGVHTSLLAFTAVFLPMSAFADLSTPAQYKSRPKRAPIEVLTETPWRTVAWMCLGVLVLQWWWAGWVRQWKLDASIHSETGAEEQPAETEAQKAERILRQKEWDSQKPQVCSHPFEENGYSVSFLFILISGHDKGCSCYPGCLCCIPHNDRTVWSSNF